MLFVSVSKSATNDLRDTGRVLVSTALLRVGINCLGAEGCADSLENNFEGTGESVSTVTDDFLGTTISFFTSVKTFTGETCFVRFTPEDILEAVETEVSSLEISKLGELLCPSEVSDEGGVIPLDTSLTITCRVDVGVLLESINRRSDCLSMSHLLPIITPPILPWRLSWLT